MSSAIPDRIVWAAETLEVRPDDQLFEIGCGNGALVDLVCRKLRTGTVTAIDRSAKMTALACERNKENISAGKATIHTSPLEAVEFPPASFDKIYLFNLNVFWMDPSAELDIVKHLLTPAGRFYIFHQPPPGGDTREYAGEFEKNLKTNGFDVLKTEFNDSPSVRAVCVISQPVR